MRMKFSLAPALLLALPALAAAQSSVFTPTRFTVQLGGAPAGKTPEILLLPGLSSSRAVFDAEAKLLEPKYRLYRVQLDGFSGQPAGANASGPVLSPVVEELHQYIVANHLHPIVIGHSLGGLLGLMLAKAHPDDVSKLLIVDTLPFYGLVFDPKATVDSIAPIASGMRDSMLKAPDASFAESATKTAGYLVKDPASAKLIAASSAASDRTVFVNAMYEDLQTDLRPQLAAIKTPSTLLYPYDPELQGPDPSKVDALYKGAYAAMPNLKFQRIDGSRHFIMYDQPIAFDAAVQTFLKP